MECSASEKDSKNGGDGYEEGASSVPAKSKEGRSRQNAKWKLMYKQLVKFKQQNGHCFVPEGDHPKLSSWVYKQRRQFRERKMPPARKNLLDDIGFSWESPDRRLAVNDAKWKLMYQQLVEFKQQNGHCLVPGDRSKLSWWVYNQRNLFRTNKMPGHRKKLLDDIGFSWESPNRRLAENHPDISHYFNDAKWEVKYRQLVEFKQQNGHCFVAGDHPKLRSWVNGQRNQFRAKKIPDHRKKLLDDIGFSWESPTRRLDSPKWMDRYKRLVELKRKNGNCIIGWNDKDLWIWAERQREQYRNGRLPAGRKKLLNDVGFPWNSPPDQRFRANRGIETDGNHDQKPRAKQAGKAHEKAKYGIGTKVQVRCDEEKEGSRKERPSKRRKLDDKSSEREPDEEDVDGSAPLKDSRGKVVTGSEVERESNQADHDAEMERTREVSSRVKSDTKRRAGRKLDDDTWMKKYEYLVEYKRAHGDCLVKYNDELLGQWVSTQRQRFRSKKIPDHRKKLLDEIGFCWEPPRHDEAVPLAIDNETEANRWKERYEALVKFKQSHGHCIVKDDPELYYWTRHQQTRFRAEKMPEDRKKLLDAIGFCWEPVDRGIKNRHVKDDESVSSAESEPEYAIGTKVQVFFDGDGWFNGRVTDYDGVRYEITYEDGDKEVCSVDELAKIVLTPDLAKVKKGTRVAVRWPRDGKFYDGTVTRRRNKRSPWCVEYDGGSFEWLSLRKRKFRLLDEGECDVGTEDEYEFEIEADESDLSEEDSADDATNSSDLEDSDSEVDSEPEKATAGMALSAVKSDTKRRTGRKFHYEKWNNMYQCLLDFKRTHGHCRVKWDDGILGSWVRYQRQAYRKKKMPDDRKKLLDGVGFCWWPKQEKQKESTHSHNDIKKVELKAQSQRTPGGQFHNAKWMDSYKQLVEFKRKNGNCIIGWNDSRDLWVWARRQREQYRNGRLPAGRKKLLIDVGFPWNNPPDQRFRANRGIETDGNDVRDQKPRAKRAGKALPHEKAKYGIGTKVQKLFQGHGWYTGDVTSFDGDYYLVTYEDGEEEEYNDEELAKIVLTSEQAREVVIGSRVAVQRRDDGQFYNGRVTKQRAGECCIEFDEDGAQEWVDLTASACKFYLLPNGHSHRAARIKVDTKQRITSNVDDAVEVGSRVSVQWPRDYRYYEGTVTQERKGRSSRWRVEYDVGGWEWVDLRKRQFHLVLGDESSEENEDTSLSLASTHVSGEERSVEGEHDDDSASGSQVLDREYSEGSKDQRNSENCNEDNENGFEWISEKNGEGQSAARNQVLVDGKDDAKRDTGRLELVVESESDSEKSDFQSLQERGGEKESIADIDRRVCGPHSVKKESTTTSVASRVQNSSVECADNETEFSAKSPSDDVAQDDARGAVEAKVEIGPLVDSQMMDGGAAGSFAKNITVGVEEDTSVSEDGPHDNTIEGSAEEGKEHDDTEHDHEWEPTREAVKKVKSDKSFQYDYAKWNEMYHRLLDFKRTYGHVLVSRRDEVALYRWVQHQREVFRLSKIPDYRKKLLDEVGFCWSVSRKATLAKINDAKWMTKYRKLVEYKEANGHCVVQYIDGYKDLGTWVRNQRVLFKDGKLPQTRKQLLDEIGFCWNKSDRRFAKNRLHEPNLIDNRWTKRYEELLEYKRVHGHCLVKRSEKILWNWASLQRRRYRANRLPEHRKKLLDDIGFYWEILRPKAASGNSSARMKLNFLDEDEEDSASGNVMTRTAVVGEVNEKRHRPGRKFDDGSCDLSLNKTSKYESVVCDASRCEGGANTTHWVGPKVKKFFEGSGWCTGTVMSCQGEEYHVTYENGIGECYSDDELSEVLFPANVEQVKVGSHLALHESDGLYHEVIVIAERNERRKPLCIEHENGSLDWIDIRQCKFRLLKGATRQRSDEIVEESDEDNDCAINIVAV